MSKTNKHAMEISDGRREFLKATTVAAFSLGGLLANAEARAIHAKTKTPEDKSAKTREVVIYLYEGMTALDAIGPYEVLRAMPDARVRFVAKKRGAIRVDSGFLTLTADAAIEEVSAPDILLLPGGATTLAQLSDKTVIEWVRQVHARTRWTTSVCTGSLILGAAGLLKGMEATTHWAALPFLKNFGATPVKKRFVKQGKIITAAGVSAGIDMALTIAALECGEEMAKAIQLAIEYDPQPPFDSGSIDKASPEVIKRANDFLSLNTKNATGLK